MQERTVATESLASLSQMLRRSRQLLQAMLAQDSLASVEFFYTRTVYIKPFEHVICWELELFQRRIKANVN